MRDDPSVGLGSSRRAFLRRCGVTASASALIGGVASAETYERVINIADEGADSSGSEPIDSVIEDYLEDDTLVQFPSGTYLVDQLSLYELSNFGMVAVDDDVTLLPAAQRDYWIAGANTENIRFEGFRIDNREDGIHPLISFGTSDGLVVRDITKVGVHDGFNEAFGISITDRDGTGVLENVRLEDGSTHKGYENGYAKAATGIYIDSAGTTVCRNCRVEGFGDNGLYASASDGAVEVIGGTFKNNDISQIRLGSPGSVVREATVVISDDLHPNAENARGIRVTNGPKQPSERVRIEACDLQLLGGRGGGGIVGAFDGGAFTVHDTRIRADDRYTIDKDGWSSYAILADPPDGLEDAGPIRVTDTTITGSAKRRDAIKFRRRSGCTVRDSCIQHRAETRDGITFDGGTDNAVRDSTVNVGGEPIKGADQTANVTYEGNCAGGSADETTTGVETGEITVEQPDGDTWTSLPVEQTYSKPVIVAGPPSSNGAHPVHVRARSDGMAVRLEEWEYVESSPSGWHTAESLGYLVAESGSYSPTDNGQIEVGTVTAGSDGSRSVSFGTAFEEKPVVLALPQTVHGADPVTARTWDVSPEGFQVLLQEEEAKGWHRTEEVGYVAVERSIDGLAGGPAEVGTRAVTDEWTYLSFRNAYRSPRLLASVQSIRGSDPMSIRFRNLSPNGVDIRLSEGQSADDETGHRAESVGYLVLDS